MHLVLFCCIFGSSLSFSSGCFRNLHPKIYKSGRKRLGFWVACADQLVGRHIQSTDPDRHLCGFSLVFCFVLAPAAPFVLAPAAPESFLLLNKLRIWRPPKNNLVLKRSVSVGAQQRGLLRFVPMGTLRPFPAFTAAPARQNEPIFPGTCASGGPS